ncbi:hypothetical protein UlMin_034617 [Ulmus minor]
MECFKIIAKFVIFLSCSCVLLSSTNPVFAQKSCDFPAIFNFGDSNSDTGGLASAFPSFIGPPYGETYFGKPAGRFSDGRLVIDFIAKSFDLPYLSAYLNSLGTNFKHGANFATYASPITLPKIVIPTSGGYSPFYLYIQYTQFNALYTFDIGQNDLAEGILGNLSVQQVNTSVPDIINRFTADFMNIYNISGGRSYWIHNTGPLGCLPYILTAFPSAERDEFGCAKPYNQIAQHFNYMLKQAIVQLRKDFPLAAITYVDIYSVKYSLFTDPHKYGFELPLVACCGYGGKYNYSSSVRCGGTITVNGSQIFVGSCERPSVRVNWDGIHYTEAANAFVFDKISTGAFSDPPVPLHKACLKA